MKIVSPLSRLVQARATRCDSVYGRISSTRQNGVCATRRNGWSDTYAISEPVEQVIAVASAVTSARAAASELAASGRKRARCGTSPALVISALTKHTFPSVTPCLPK